MENGALISEYLYERQGLEILEVAHGFISYKISGGDCHISDMYVRPSERRTHLCKQLIDSLESIARERGCSKLTGAIHLWDQGKEVTLKAALKLGFRVVRADQGMILISKEL